MLYHCFLRMYWKNYLKKLILELISIQVMYGQRRTQGEGFGVKSPSSLVLYKNFITCAKEINCFRIHFAC